MIIRRKRRCVLALALTSVTGTLMFMILSLTDETLLIHREYFREANRSETARHVTDNVTEAEKSPTTVIRVTKSRPAAQRHDILNINNLLQPRRNTSFNCSKLLQGDKNETQRVESYRKKFPHKELSLDVFMNVTRNCDIYKSERGYVTRSSAEERSYPIAYSIVIHKFVDQFERLLRAIYRPQNYYCIHVDRKVKNKFHAVIKAITDCFENVFIASKLEVVVYAGFTRLQADLNCMEELYSKYHDWKYVLNAAGTEFPLKSNKELVQLLKIYNGTNIIGKSLRTLNPWRWEKRYETVVKNLTGKIYNTKKSHVPPPFNLTITKGSAYAVFSRAFVNYVLHDPVPMKFLEWSRNTYSPDEHFWATLNNLEHNSQLNTPGGDSATGLNFMTRTVLWGSKSCHGKNMRGVCVFGVGDLPWLSQRQEFFANKFLFSVDEVAYSCMENLLKIRETRKKVQPWDLAYHLEYLKTHRTLH